MSATNWSLPTLTSTYANFLTELGKRDVSAITQMRSDLTADTNTPNGAIRWNNSNLNWQSWDGSAWSLLALTYGINVATADNTATAVNALNFDGLPPSSYALLTSPTFLGTPSMPTGAIGVTQANGNSTTKLATTEFVKNAINYNALMSPGVNMIIGGDFTLNPWQRGVSFPSVINGTYLADRWLHTKSGTGVVAITKSTDAPTSGQAGVHSQHSLAVEVTTFRFPAGASDFYTVGQKIEGFNCSNLGFGQAGTRFFTKSFWVKASKVGIHCVSFRNSALNRSYVKEYTINAANTWEFNILTIPVDTAGTWVYDKDVGLNVQFALSAGVNFQTTANTWVTGNFLTTANQVNELDSNGNMFKIALVQLEAGTTATQFESRSAGQELFLCQRYTQFYNQFFVSGNTAAGGIVFVSLPFGVPMRVAPTVTTSSATFSNASALIIPTVYADNMRPQVTITTAGYGYGVANFLLSSEL